MIICNAIAFGVEAHFTMVHALEHVGLQEDWKPTMWLYAVKLSFTCFYTLELSMRLLVHRCHFFTCADRYWNKFDMVLVIVAIYEDVSNVVSIDVGITNLTWLRIVRLLKMMKVLRVFRLMRFFRELRMMMASLLGSCMALLWSIVLLGLIKWVVSLMFIQCLSSYLLETPVEEIDVDTLDGIVIHWNSVLESMCTLFKSTTGGNDWSDLAQPIRVASASSHHLFYLLFLLYIIFFIVALLNILTGMFVDAAVKVGDRDNEEMVDLAIEDAYSDDKVGKFTEFILDQMPDNCSSDDNHFSWEVISRHRHSEPVKDLFRAFQLDFKEARKVFRILEMVKGPGSLVSVEEFITVCEMKLKNGNIDMLRMEHEIKRISERVKRIKDHMEASSRSAGPEEKMRPDALRANGAPLFHLAEERRSGHAARHKPRDLPGIMPMP